MTRSSNPESDPGAASYQGDRGRAYHEEKRALNPLGEEWVFRLRARKFAPWVRPTDTVFELGVGAGWNLARLPCAQRLGSDAADFLQDRVRRLGISFIAGTHDVPDATADVALCHHTLEHLVEPAGALRELGRLLKPGGRLVLHVPWEREWRYGTFDPGEPNRHLYTWNSQTLGNLLTTLGWQELEMRVRRYGYDRFAANHAARWRLGESGFRWMRRVLIALRPLHEVEALARK